jgi:hypothetical protein
MAASPSKTALKSSESTLRGLPPLLLATLFHYSCDLVGIGPWQTHLDQLSYQLTQAQPEM